MQQDSLSEMQIGGATQCKTIRFAYGASAAVPGGVCALTELHPSRYQTRQLPHG